MTSTDQQRGRLLGLDTARAIAVFGMIAVNVGPSDDQIPVDGFDDWLYTIPHGRASLLFVLLAGVGLSLLTSRARQTPAPQGRGASGSDGRGSGGSTPAIIRVLWRAGLLLGGGLALQLLGHQVNVILPVYAVLFVVGGLVIRASDRVVLAVAGTSLLLGPPLWLLLPREATSSPDLQTPPLQIVESLLWSGPYPAITWLAPFMFGMWLGRRRLDRPAVPIRLIVWGLGVAVVASVLSNLGTRLVYDDGDPVGASMLFTSAAHGQMPLWIISGTAVGVACIGASLWATSAWPGLCRPLTLTGQLALTVYVGHLFALAAIRPFPPDRSAGALVTLALVLAAVAFSCLWRAHFRRGPLEQALRVPEMVGAHRSQRLRGLR